MTTFATDVRIEGAHASIGSLGNGASVEVDGDLIWDAAGLLALAEAIRGAAAMLQTRAVGSV